MRKLKMMLCVMMLPLVVVGCTSKQSVSQCVKPPPPPAWIMQPPPRLADTAERDYFTLRERLVMMQAQLEGAQQYITEQCLK
ncbi:lysis protein [Escherichia coli]|nr:lysis protein [Escherichia coli]